MAAFPTHTATRYVTPLREGGSLPAVLETETGGMFVAKFRGAGQGARALIAELLAARLAEGLGLPVPEAALIHLDESFGRTERDPEIQDILKGSRGLNMGLRYLPGAFNYDPLAVPEIDPDLAAEIVWFDAFITNIDRSPRNPNLLFHQEKLWMIDHGAALYFHHDWNSLTPERIRSRFTPTSRHVLLPFAGNLHAADARMSERLTDLVLQEAAAALPEELLMDAPAGSPPPFPSAGENREAYLKYFRERLQSPRDFAAEAIEAQKKKQAERPEQLGYRR